MTKLEEINNTMSSLAVPVTEDEVVSINIIIISWIWKDCLGKKFPELAETLGMSNDRTLQDLRSGLCNHESYNVINKRVAEDIGQRLSMPANVFLGKEGILFRDESKKVILKELVLYRRLLRLKKHELHREYLINEGLLEGFLKKETYSVVLNELKNTELEFEKTDGLLDSIKKKAVTALKSHIDNIDSTKARGNHYYPRLLHFFKYEHNALNDKVRIDTIIEAMRYWEPDNLKAIDGAVLKDYLNALRRQESFVQTTLYLKEGTKEN